MSTSLGIIFSLCALLAWGFGDFFIQKSTRVVGIWKTLFFIAIVSTIGLFPFIKNEIVPTISHSSNLTLLILLTAITVFGALFSFESLKQGKIAVVEPVLGIEFPITIGLSVVLWNEHIDLLQSFLMVLIFIGIILAITEHHTHLHFHKRIFEKGVILAGVGAIAMALMNFLVGVSSQEISPLMTIWSVHVLLLIISFVYILISGGLKTIISDFKKHPKIILSQSILDNLAWISFAMATTLIPISIATSISESYIALAVLLGVFINREKLKYHQIFGVIFAISGVIILSIITSF